MECVTNSAAMQKTFPELTGLNLTMDDDGPVLPDSFLGGTAPRLRSLDLYLLPFPGSRKLLSTATHLVRLELANDPNIVEKMPPETMVTSIYALTCLEYLSLFGSYSPPDLESRRLPSPPRTRFILPNLTTIDFISFSEYLEEILARIDTPRLNEMHINFSDTLIFESPQLFKFISRRPNITAPKRAILYLILMTSHSNSHHKHQNSENSA